MKSKTMRMFKTFLEDVPRGVADVGGGCGATSNGGKPRGRRRRRPEDAADGARWQLAEIRGSAADVHGRRINGSVTLNVNMQEFQQRVLPASVYAGAARAVQRRHVPMGLQHQQHRRELAGAHDRGVARDGNDRASTPTTCATRACRACSPSTRRSTGPIRWAPRPATTASTDRRWPGRARSPTRGRSPRSCTCTAPRFCRSTTAIPTHGSRPGCRSAGRLLHQHVQLRRTRRRRRRSGSTITRSASCA